MEKHPLSLVKIIAISGVIIGFVGLFISYYLGKRHRKELAEKRNRENKYSSSRAGGGGVAG